MGNDRRKLHRELLQAEAATFDGDAGDAERAVVHVGIDMLIAARQPHRVRSVEEYMALDQEATE